MRKLMVFLIVAVPVATMFPDQVRAESSLKDASKVHASTRARVDATLSGGSTYPAKSGATKVKKPDGSHTRYEPHSKDIGSTKQPPKKYK